MGINTKEQMGIFNIITAYPECVDWHCIGRNEPSPEAYSAAVNYMPKGSYKHELMRNAILEAFPTAKEIRYYRQLKLLALIFEADENGVSALSLLRKSVRIKEGMKQRGLTTIKSVSEAITPQKEAL